MRHSGIRFSNQFQSTPPRGWRLGCGVISPLRSFHFNPLHREGGDTGTGCRCKDAGAISIHSTARVETSLLPTPLTDCLFQSTPPRGWRRTAFPQSRGIRNFNPLHREGGDGRSLAFPPGPCYFNPLHREGGDGPPPWQAGFHGISIHSTARVETQQTGGEGQDGQISIHSTARVETICINLQHLSFGISIHSTARVETFLQ